MQAIPKDIRKWKRLLLLGLVVTNKVINKEALRTMMKGVWKLRGTVDFKEVGHNLFLIGFFENLDIQKVQEGRP